MSDQFRTSTKARAAERQELSLGVETSIARGELDVAFQQIIDAARRYEDAGDIDGQALTLYLLGKYYRRSNDLPASLETLQKSHERYQAIPDSLRCADVLLAKAVTLRLMGRDEEAIRDLKQSRDIYRQMGTPAQEMHTLMSLSILYKQSGDIASSQTLLYECLSFFEQSEQTDVNISDTAKVLLNIAINYNLLDNPAEAIRFAKRGITLFEAGEDLHSLSMALNVLGDSYQKQNDDETALEHYHTALGIAEKIGNRWGIAIILDDMSKILMHQKRFDEAREVLERCVRLNGGDDNRLVYCGNITQLGHLYAHPEYSERDTAQALACLREARQIAEEHDTVMLLVEIHKALADLYERNGDFPQALESFRAFHAAEKRLFNEESDRRTKLLEVQKAQKDTEIAHLRMVELAQALEEAERLRALADEQVRTDVLTGMLSRRALDEYLEEEFERSRQYDRPFAVALVDVDYFKRINDSLGHGAGDNTLRHIAHILRTHCRSGVRAARYGGEEFALLFPETDLATARTLCECLREAVEAYDWTAVHPALSSVTVSIGVTMLDRRGKEGLTAASHLLDDADRNLYRAKQAGRNRVVG